MGADMAKKDLKVVDKTTSLNNAILDIKKQFGEGQ